MQSLSETSVSFQCEDPAIQRVFDQAEIEKRDDVLCYTTALLREDIEVAGPVKLDLYASTSAVDTDFFAKLVDVEPDGYVANISEGMLRARFRNGCEAEELLEGGEIVHYEIQIADVAHTFKAGHRLHALHIADNEGKTDQHMMPYGRGNVDFAEVVAALREVDYHGLFNLEIPGERLAPLPVLGYKLEYIRKCYKYLMEN